MTAIAYQLGVDLGTTFMAAAVVRDGRAEPVTLGNHGAAVPSVVFLGAEGEGLVVGEAAELRAASDPTRVARQFKRRVGDPAPILVGGAPVAAEMLMARSLDWVVGEVARTEGEPPASLAVTHPANWGEYKLDLLRQAFRHVGLRVDHLVPEPVAAAHYYAVQRHPPPGSVVAVYDLGGGTFDAAVVQVDGPASTIRGRPDGIERLGGIDFDEAVFGHVLATLGPDVGDLDDIDELGDLDANEGDLEDLDADHRALRSGLAALRRDCVEAKEALSSQTDVAIPVMLPGRHRQVRLTRTEFEAMIRPALAETVVALRRAIASAGVEVEDVAAVLLVGGSSRIPLVGQLVGAELRRPIAIDARPKDAIPMGAALVASAAGPGPGPGSGTGTGTGSASATAEPPSRPKPAAPAPGGPGRRPVPSRLVVRAVAAVVAVAAALVAVLVLRDDGGSRAGEDGDGAARRATEGYAPAADGAIADNFDLGGAALTVGWKDQPEAELMGQVTQLALEAAGAEVDNRVAPVASDALHDGLVSGDVDLYWDYLIDVWRGALDRRERAPHDAGRMHEAVSEADAGSGVTWLGPTAFNAPYTIMIGGGTAGDLGVESFSDLGTLGEVQNASLCAAQDPSALVEGVEAAYRLDLPDWQQVEAGDLYRRVADGSCTVGVGVATSGAAQAQGLVPLRDDREALPAANAALGVRAPVLDDHPELEDLFAPIARALDDDTIRSLNQQVEVDGAAPRDVAHRWLADQGFVPAPGPTGPDIAAEFDLSGASFTMASVDTDAQVLLGEIARLALEAAGAEVESRTVPVGTGEARAELLAGRVDLYWEFLAEAWIEHLGHVDLAPSAEALFDQVASEDAGNGITWFPPAAFDRGWAVVTTRERADELGIDSIADLVDLADLADLQGDTVVCGEINNSARGWIEDAYGFDIRSFEVVEDDVEGLVDSGDCAFGIVRASSPWVAGLDLVVLGDEERAMPPDRAAIAARSDVATRHPQLEQLVGALGGALTDDTVRGLLSRVVADGEDPAAVARDWLQEGGFVRG